MPKLRSPKSLLQSVRFNKLTIILVAALISIIGVVVVVSSRAAGPYMFLSSVTGIYQGSTFDVKIYENSYTTSINAAEADITFPTDKLSYVSVDYAGTPFSLHAPEVTGDGVVKFASASTKNVTGKQLVATVRFKALVGGGQYAALNFGSGSALINPTTQQNVLSYTTSKAYKLLSPTTGAPLMKLLPATGSYVASTKPVIKVTVKEDSKAYPINVAQAIIDYPANLLQYDHVVYNSGFSQAIGPINNNGSLTIVAALLGAQLTGPHSVADVYFKVIGSGTANLSLHTGSALIDSTTNQNILQVTLPAKYSLTYP